MIGEILVMDTLVLYDTSSSNSYVDGVTDDEPLPKKPANGQTPCLVTVADDTWSCTSGEDDPLICVGVADTMKRPSKQIAI